MSIPKSKKNKLGFIYILYAMNDTALKIQLFFEKTFTKAKKCSIIFVKCI